jgi:hypothetical protein
MILSWKGLALGEDEEPGIGGQPQSTALVHLYLPADIVVPQL